MMGTVGVPMTTIETRLESVPEMGYDALSSVPRGEICLRGKSLFSGYQKRQDLTEEVLIDGWFHTGDIGELQPNGAMKIIGRKKNIFKLSQGEYVAVENIESKYLQCPLITSIWVYGNSFESFLVAVVVPDRKALEDWAAEHHLTDDFKSLCQNLKARKYILDELNSVGQKQQLRGFELLKAVHLEPNPFDMERDLITPTFKLKRPHLLKYYKQRKQGYDSNVESRKLLEKTFLPQFPKDVIADSGQVLPTKTLDSDLCSVLLSFLLLVLSSSLYSIVNRPEEASETIRQLQQGAIKAQDHGAPNAISWMPYREPQHSFQPCNPASFPLQFQDLQVSNDIVRSQAMNLMIDKPHTASNVDQTGDGIWNHGFVMLSVIPLL
ncbi:hypothetical protein ACE6H2_016175 [Prunus campanulata]